MTVTLKAHAKINWMLRVLARRPDGYHEIETIFQTVSLHDVVSVRRAKQFAFRCDDPCLPRGETNLVARAARAASAEFRLPPVEIELTKSIPAGAGLGGGSSDAAATLRALARLFDLADEERLSEIALSLGSDVPYFLHGGMAYGTGRGEQLQTLPGEEGVALLLAAPNERVATADAYRWLDETPRDSIPLGYAAARDIASGLSGSADRLTNDFEPVVFARMPFLEKLKTAMRETGAWWSGMTGSGSTIVGAFPDREARDRAATELAGFVRVISAETTEIASRKSLLS